MSKGLVKWFNNTMKFGFLLTPEGREVFVHFSDIQSEGYKTLKKGETVEFDIQETPKGGRAIHVKRLNPPRRVQKKNGRDEPQLHCETMQKDRGQDRNENKY